MAPIITFIPSFTLLRLIPFSDRMFNSPNLNVGLLYYVALSGISTIGIVLGGWASNNKYALLGGMRSAAQMISYEVPLVISVVGVIMMTGSLNLRELLIIKQAVSGIGISFLRFSALSFSLSRRYRSLIERRLTCRKRSPSLLRVIMWNTAASASRFSCYRNMFTCIAIARLTTVLFLGGGMRRSVPDFIPGIIWFLLKFSFVVFFLFWIRATLPAGTGGSIDGAWLEGAASAGTG